MSVSGRLAVPLVAVAAAVAVGLVAAAVEPTLYRAEATLVVERGGKPVTGDPALARQLAELARSDVVVRNVSDALGRRVDGGRLHTRAADGVVKLSYDAGSRAEGVRVVQQVAVEFSRLVTSRFGSSGESVAVFDPAHSGSRVSPHVARDVLLGLLAGLVAAVAISGRVRLPARRRALRERGRWRVSALSDLVERSAGRYPDRVEEWRAYVGVLRGQAEGDLVPAALDGVVREVFGPILPP